MEKSKKILVFVGIGLLAAIGIYVGIKYANKKGEKDKTKEEEEPKLVIDEVLDFPDGLVGVQYTFGEVISSYDSFGKQQNIKPKKDSIYTLQIDTITDPDTIVYFDLFKNNKFLKTLRKF